MQARVTVLAFNLHNWTDQPEARLISELKNVDFIYLETTKKDFLNWAFSSVLEKLAGKFSKLFPKSVYWASVAVSKRSWLILQWLKKSNIHPDFIIAHNPAAFYPVNWFATEKNIPYAIDIEDYHPGEVQDEGIKKSLELLMQHCIVSSAYTSYAAPLIKLYTENNLVQNTGASIVINNLFSKDEFVAPVDKGSSKLQLVWFSQYVDKGRGLEKLLPILDDFKNEIELTLIGNLRTDLFEQELKHRNYIICKDSLAHEVLQKELSNYDIGLAIEDPNADSNRNICLTNKIWSYFQSGLYIVATNTDAQNIFIDQHPSHGVLCSFNAEKLKLVFVEILKNKLQLKSSRLQRYQNAASFNWEFESMGLVKQWVGILR